MRPLRDTRNLPGVLEGGASGEAWDVDFFKVTKRRTADFAEDPHGKVLNT